MNYEIIEVESYGVTTKHIIIDNGDGEFTSFPANEDNPNYQAWLEQGNPPVI